MSGKTLFDKIWDAHVVTSDPSGEDLIYLDRHLIHEGSRNGFTQLAERSLGVRRSDLTFGTPDHYVPTTNMNGDAGMAAILNTYRANVAAAGVPAIDPSNPERGIVHVIGPELGLSQPGMTIVCGDSHTATHGALGAVAFGIGASDVAHVLATQTLWQRRPRQMRIVVSGLLPRGVWAKDLILAIIARIGSNGGSGYAIEYCGEAVTRLSIEERLTLCNMTIEAGARFGIVAPDDKTFHYLQGRRHAPPAPEWDEAVKGWRRLFSDADAIFDREYHFDAGTIAPMVSWGTSPQDSVAVDGRIPDCGTSDDAAGFGRSCEYMGVAPGKPLSELLFDRVFIGSCTNGRIEDLRTAARIFAGRRAIVPTVIVPGSGLVRAQAEQEGLAAIFRDAGCEWRLPGCSFCVGMNGDVIAPGERCASTSNRNFMGRQGPGARTHLMSPATAALVSVTGRIGDTRALGIVA